MDFLSIESFLSLVRNQSLSGAAKELHLVQPTISHRLKTLEQELGVVLIERHKGIKEIKLTPIGEEFLGLAMQWSSLWRQAQMLQSKGATITLSIGALDSLNTVVFPPLYRAIRHHQLPVQLNIQTHHTQYMYQEIEKRNLDVAYVLRDRAHPNVKVEPYFKAEMVVMRTASPADDTSRSIHPQDLDPDYELLMPWGPLFQTWHEKHWSPSSPLRVRLDSINLLLRLMDNPLQWAIVPSWVTKFASERGSFSFFRLSDPPPDLICYKMFHKDAPRNTLRNIAIIDSYFDIILNHLFDLLVGVG